jgi:MFS family permease
VKQSIWTRDFILVTCINFFLYVIYYQLMLWSTNYAMATWHVSIGEAGLASSVFIIGALIARMLTGHVVDILGRKRILVLAAVIYLAALPLYFVASEISLFILVRIIHGFAYGASSTAAGTIVGAIVPVARRGEGIGYFALGNTLASAIGPFLGIMLCAGGEYFNNIYECIVIAALTLVMSVILKTPEHAATAEEKEALKEISFSSFFAVKALPISVIGFFSGIAYSSILSYLGAYAQSLNLVSAGSLFFIAYAALSFLSRLFTGRMLDNYGGNVVMYPALLCLMACLLVVGFASGPLYFIIGGILLGLGFATISSVGQALSIQGIPGSQIGLATSTFFVMIDLGIGVGPYTLGAAVPAFGFSGVYFLAALIVFLSVPLYYVLISRYGMFSVRWMKVIQRKTEWQEEKKKRRSV